MPPRVTVSTDQIRTKGSGQIRKQYLISALKILSNWFFLFQNPKKTSELAQRDNFIENLKDFNPLRLFHIRPFGRKKKGVHKVLWDWFSTSSFHRKNSWVLFRSSYIHFHWEVKCTCSLNFPLQNSLWFLQNSCILFPPIMNLVRWKS